MEQKKWRKSRESKDILPPTRRSQHICDPRKLVYENNIGHGVQVDIEHGDVEANIVHGVVQSDEFVAKSIKEIIYQHEKKGRKSLEIIYEKIKDIFEGTKLPTSTLDVGKDTFFPVSASHEETIVTSDVPPSTPVASPDEIGSAKNIVRGSKDVHAFVKRQRLYRYIERNAKERN